MSGGIEPGSLVALMAGPTMQSEAILHELIRMRPTLHLTTLRSAAAAEEDLERLSAEDLYVEYAGPDRTMNNELLGEITGSRSYTPSFTNDGTLLDTVYEVVQDIDSQANVILDPVNPLEETDNKNAYREVLNELKAAMLETNGVGILHCITLDEAPPFRDVTLTLADTVWELNLISLKSTLEYQLTIPKNRGGTPVLDEISIVLEKDVWVDESRNI
jgi:hypothetical protein